MIHIGFAGTQEGMTDAQHVYLTRLMGSTDEDYCIHHGDCVGSDAQFHAICDGHTTFIGAHVYPCNVESKRAHCLHSVQRV